MRNHNRDAPVLAGRHLRALEIEAVHFTWLWIRDVARTADLQTGDDVTSMDRPCIIGSGSLRTCSASGLGGRFG